MLTAAPDTPPWRCAYSPHDRSMNAKPCHSVCRARRVPLQNAWSSTPGVRWNNARLNKLRLLSLMRAAISSARTLRRRVCLSAASTSARVCASFCALLRNFLALSGRARRGRRAEFGEAAVDLGKLGVEHIELCTQSITDRRKLVAQLAQTLIAMPIMADRLLDFVEQLLDRREIAR